MSDWTSVKVTDVYIREEPPYRLVVLSKRNQKEAAAVVVAWTVTAHRLIGANGTAPTVTIAKRRAERALELLVEINRLTG